VLFILYFNIITLDKGEISKDEKKRNKILMSTFSRIPCPSNKTLFSKCYYAERNLYCSYCGRTNFVFASVCGRTNFAFAFVCGRTLYMMKRIDSSKVNHPIIESKMKS